jgi:DMATS type aromatic prenyltransferase
MFHTKPDNSHDEFWRRTSGVALSTFLSYAWYSPIAQTKILHFFTSRIVPYLGRANDSGSEARAWKSFMTDDHNPIELSWDWGTGEGLPVIRFSVEPVGLDAGTPADPENAYAAANFKHDILNTLPDTNMTWFDHFEGFFNGYETHGAAEGHHTKVFWAFDLREDGITSKAYFFPGYRAQLFGQTNLETITQGIEQAPLCQGGKLPAFEMFRDFIIATPDAAYELDMLAIDLINPRDSRLKIYFRGRQTSFASIYKTMTLDGRLAGEDLERGLEQLRQLWDLLFVSGLTSSCHRTAGILYYVEFRIDSKTPKVKIYIPVRHYAPNDGHVIRTLNDWMGMRMGGCGPANYDRAMRSIL